MVKNYYYYYQQNLKHLNCFFKSQISTKNKTSFLNLSQFWRWTTIIVIYEEYWTWNEIQLLLIALRPLLILDENDVNDENLEEFVVVDEKATTITIVHNLCY